ncbi:MAG: hypothetical protein JWN01_201 [Patescibacteria group bacterium]|nr:hypothetical protein [Patescibacteria group bacterium]
MTFLNRLRALDKRLRVMLIATGMLIVPQLGQFLAIRDLNTTGHEGTIAFFFLVVGVFTIPTSLIVSSSIIYVARKHIREQERVVLLGALNLLIILNLVWFFVHQCSWSQVFGIALRTCHQ